MTADPFDQLEPWLVPPGAGQHRLFHGRGGSEPGEAALKAIHYLYRRPPGLPDS